MSPNEKWADAIAVVLLVLAFVYLTSTLRKGVLRMRRNGAMLVDHDGWQLTLADDRLWIVRFSPDWRKRYRSTWAIGWKRTHVWFHTPKGEGNGEGYGDIDT